MNDTALTIENVTKRYGSLAALDNVSLSIAPGERLALLGHNGAGKTTLIKLVLGLIFPDEGKIDIFGKPPTSEVVRRVSAYLPESVAFHKSLTGREQLTMFARLKGQPSRVVKEILVRVGLETAMDRRIGAYSKGMRQRLGLAQVLIGRPQLVVLDEPTSGLDPLSREFFYTMISELADAGAAVLLSSHALTELEARTDRIVILRHGNVVADGPLQKLRAGAQLPIRVSVEASLDSADELARRYGGTRINGRSVEFMCDASDKIRRLSEVAAFVPTVEDIDVVLPSLEDVYRHYSRQVNGEEKVQ